MIPTLWEQYKGFVIGGIAVFLAQTLLVIGLLIQRRHKRRAEQSLRQKTEELDQFFNVNLDVLCIANTDGYFLRLNPAMRKDPWLYPRRTDGEAVPRLRAP